MELDKTEARRGTEIENETIFCLRDRRNFAPAQSREQNWP